MKEGETPLVKRKGRGVIAKFTLVHGKEVIEPWKGKDAEVMEWMRNASAMLGDLREEMAVFWKTEKGDIYYEDSLVPNKTMLKAFFTSDVDGRPYDVAARLVEDTGIKPGDRVKLTIMGCCSIISVNKEK